MTPAHLLATALPTLIFVAVVVTVGYLGFCYERPFGWCRRCGGTGRRKGLTGRLLRSDCRRCHGTGRRLRIGRYPINLARRIRCHLAHPPAPAGESRARALRALTRTEED